MTLFMVRSNSRFQSTPPRGWRPLLDGRLLRSCRFQSTPPRGWRLDTGNGAVAKYFYFNPLHREGGDDKADMAVSGGYNISIHSTARVETSVQPGCPALGRDFNPLHREGGDHTMEEIYYEYKNFNPLHREGGDDTFDLVQRKWNNFNPLHREGGDLTATPSWAARSIFQSTPPRGWRQQYYTITTTILHHISTNKSYPTPLKSRPTIPAHSQIRSHCANFPVRIPP